MDELLIHHEMNCFIAWLRSIFCCCCKPKRPSNFVGGYLTFEGGFLKVEDGLFVCDVV